MYRRKNAGTYENCTPIFSVQPDYTQQISAKHQLLRSCLYQHTQEPAKQINNMEPAGSQLRASVEKSNQNTKTDDAGARHNSEEKMRGCIPRHSSLPSAEKAFPDLFFRPGTIDGSQQQYPDKSQIHQQECHVLPYFGKKNEQRLQQQITQHSSEKQQRYG